MMNKHTWAKAAVVLVLALGFVFTACDIFTGGGADATPAAGDFTISGRRQDYNGSARTVTITPKSGKSSGAITVYYKGTGATSYAKSKTAPSSAGTYAVTFDVAAASGWKAATGLSAGTLTITAVPTAAVPIAADFTISGLRQDYNGSARTVTITPKSGKSSGAITIYYEGTGHAKSKTAPSSAGTYAVTFDVAAASGWKAATGLSAGNLVISASASSAVNKHRVSIVNKKFMVDGGTKQIWFNGANTPWQGDEGSGWNNFGGSGWNATNKNWWDKEFKKMHDNGINATRVWLNCDNGNNQVIISAGGAVSGVSSQHWADLDILFELAEKHKIYIMATLLSFDHFKQGNAHGDRWTSMVKNRDNVKSFGDIYTKPFVNRYKDNPFLWSIDLCNEPEWMTPDEGGNGNLPNNPLTWAELQYFFAYNASVIHANSDILVTVGFACIKYNADGQNFNGNKVSDASLKAQYSTGNPCIDFWSPHTYAWVGPYYGVAHYLSPYGARQGSGSAGYYGGYGLDSSKPAVIGECSAAGTSSAERGYVRPADRPPGSNSMTTDYEYAYKNGWQGVLPWTSNGVDGNGAINSAATLNMKNNYGGAIFPFGYGN
ncbi:MAG: MBG domain-containing protein [Treponema sp.]|jgi:major membrane immunogen (membrane-anchored lipoprotein)|nr:MBG domain-containing protein [Treponema sp.]